MAVTAYDTITAAADWADAVTAIGVVAAALAYLIVGALFGLLVHKWAHAQGTCLTWFGGGSSAYAAASDFVPVANAAFANTVSNGAGGYATPHYSCSPAGVPTALSQQSNCTDNTQTGFPLLTLASQSSSGSACPTNCTGLPTLDIITPIAR